MVQDCRCLQRKWCMQSDWMQLALAHRCLQDREHRHLGYFHTYLQGMEYTATPQLGLKMQSQVGQMC